MLCVKKLSESPWRNTTKQNKRERCDKKHEKYDVGEHRKSSQWFFA